MVGGIKTNPNKIKRVGGIKPRPAEIGGIKSKPHKIKTVDGIKYKTNKLKT